MVQKVMFDFTTTFTSRVGHTNSVVTIWEHICVTINVERAHVKGETSTPIIVKVSEFSAMIAELFFCKLYRLSYVFWCIYPIHSVVCIDHRLFGFVMKLISELLREIRVLRNVSGSLLALYSEFSIFSRNQNVQESKTRSRQSNIHNIHQIMVQFQRHNYL